jgi:hypothetical protein
METRIKINKVKATFKERCPKQSQATTAMHPEGTKPKLGVGIRTTKPPAIAISRKSSPGIVY